jgi:hypothetical protein
VKDAFALGATLTRRTRQLTILGAHLASAASRLASVEDVLDKACCNRTSYRECRQHFSSSKKALRSDSRGSTCSEWFHIMLRDGVGHHETPEAPSEEHERRYRARQTCLESTTFREAYSKLVEIAGGLEGVMKGR